MLLQESVVSGRAPARLFAPLLVTGSCHCCTVLRCWVLVHPRVAKEQNLSCNHETLLCPCSRLVCEFGVKVLVVASSTALRMLIDLISKPTALHLCIASAALPVCAHVSPYHLVLYPA